MHENALPSPPFHVATNKRTFAKFGTMHLHLSHGKAHKRHLFTLKVQGEGEGSQPTIGPNQIQPCPKSFFGGGDSGAGRCARF